YSSVKHSSCTKVYTLSLHDALPICIGKVQYINDSKATNVNATYFALESVNAPVIWIAGGVDKGNDYDELLQFVNEKVKAIICLGIDNEKIKNTFGKVIDVILEIGRASCREWW